MTSSSRFRVLHQFHANVPALKNTIHAISAIQRSMVSLRLPETKSPQDCTTGVCTTILSVSSDQFLVSVSQELCTSWFSMPAKVLPTAFRTLFSLSFQKLCLLKPFFENSTAPKTLFVYSFRTVSAPSPDYFQARRPTTAHR